tara:strand:+ start:27953 stop:29794 length:1842 start_codon:yes stop_codon:yes gene_type:complete
MTTDLFITQLAAYTAPKIIEVKSKDWVLYGEDNDYFNYLIQLYINSTTNHSIINGIANQVYGRGIAATNADQKPEQYAQMCSIFKKTCLRKFIKDFKLLGMAAFQVTFKEGKVVAATHFPMECLRAEKYSKKDEIEAWYYASDWSKIGYGKKPMRIPAFNPKSPVGNQMFVLRPYVPGHYFYSPPDYTGGLPYAKLEDEIGDYLINDTINNFSGTKVVNFNNGVPTIEKMEQIKQDVLSKLTGARGEKVIVAFNNNQESKTTVDDIPLNDAPAHYQYLSDECFKKLIVAHRVTSPMLLGVRDGSNSLGNNADEIETATLLFDNIVIKSYQDQVIDAMNEILSVNEIALDLYFKTLKPLAFNDIDQLEGVDEDVVEEETGVELEHHCLSEDLSKEDEKIILGSLANSGKKMNEEWVYVDELEEGSEYSNEDWANYLIADKKLSTIDKLKNAVGLNKEYVTSEKLGSDYSYLDSKNGKYKIRYKYAKSPKAKPLLAGNSSRDFCRNMMNMSNAGIVWRIEDIDKASWFDNVNVEFRHDNKRFDIFKLKGGIYCRHIWKKVLFRLASNTEPSENLGNYNRTRTIPKSYQKFPRGTKQAGIAPDNLTGAEARGRYPR